MHNACLFSSSALGQGFLQLLSHLFPNPSISNLALLQYRCAQSRAVCSEEGRQEGLEPPPNIHHRAALFPLTTS